MTKVAEPKSLPLEEEKPILTVESAKSVLYQCDIARRLGYTPFAVGQAKRLVYGSYVNMVKRSDLIASFTLADVLEAGEKHAPIPLLTLDKYFDEPNPAFFVVWETLNALTDDENTALWSSLNLVEVMRVWEYATAFLIPLTSRLYKSFLRYTFAALIRERDARDYILEYDTDRVGLIRKPRMVHPTYWAALEQRHTNYINGQNNLSLHEEEKWLHDHLHFSHPNEGKLHPLQYDLYLLDYYTTLKRLEKTHNVAFFLRELEKVAPPYLLNELHFGRRNACIPVSHIELLHEGIDLTRYTPDSYTVEINDITDGKAIPLGVYPLQNYLRVASHAIGGMDFPEYEKIRLTSLTPTVKVDAKRPLSNVYATDPFTAPFVRGNILLGLPDSLLIPMTAAQVNFKSYWLSEAFPERRFRLRFFITPEPSPQPIKTDVTPPPFTGERVPLPQIERKLRVPPLVLTPVPTPHEGSSSEEDEGDEGDEDDPFIPRIVLPCIKDVEDDSPSEVDSSARLTFDDIANIATRIQQHFAVKP